MASEHAQIFDGLASTLVAGLAETRTDEKDVPEEWSFDASEGDSDVELRSRAFVGDKVAFGRVVRVDAGRRAQTVSGLIVPRLATTLPELCLEMHSTEAGVELVLLELCQVASSDVSECLYPDWLRAGDTLPDWLIE